MQTTEKGMSRVWLIYHQKKHPRPTLKSWSFFFLKISYENIDAVEYNNEKLRSSI